MSNIGKEVLRCIRAVLPNEEQIYALHEPTFHGNELAYVSECVKTGWVSSAGTFVDRIEKQLADYVGVKRAVAVVNGTTALQIALLSTGLQAGDEVLVPALSFVATANAVVHAGGVPHFVDTGRHTLNMDAGLLGEYLEKVAMVSAGICRNKITGRRIFGIIPVHIFGHPCEMDRLTVLSYAYGLTMVEDIAEGLGSRYGSKHVGNFGKVAALSFNGNKIVTTGGGGAVLTDDENLADQIKHLTTTAKLPHRWEYVHDAVGHNFRMPNINAALGCGQLEQLDSFLAKKRKLAHRYAEAFKGLADIRFVGEPEKCVSNFWLNTISLTEPNKPLRDEVLQILNDHKIQSRPIWKLLHTLPMYTDSPRADIRHAVYHEAACINVPSSPFLVNA